MSFTSNSKGERRGGTSSSWADLTTFDLYAATDYEYTYGLRLWLELTGGSAFLQSVDKLLLPECSDRRTECITEVQIGVEPTLQLRVQRSAAVASTSFASVTPSLGYSVASEAGNAMVKRLRALWLRYATTDRAGQMNSTATAASARAWWLREGLASCFTTCCWTAEYADLQPL